ncbi:hypothetical protein ACQJBY_018696 [Aegilops geniculata]
MLRSIITRSQPLLSHLRWRAAAAPGAAKPRILPSRAYTTDDGTARPNGADGRAAAAAESNLRRHLYVVLKERRSVTHSIYKLDVDDLHCGGGGDDEAPRRLPGPALRLGVSLVGGDTHFDALGSSIVMTAHSSTLSVLFCRSPYFLTLVYDTKTGKLDGGRPPHEFPPGPFDDEPDGDVLEAREWFPSHPYQAAPVGDKLWALNGEEESTPGYLAYEEPDEEWAWKMCRSPLPQDAGGGHSRVMSHAVHPDGRTVFASSSFTFSLDTKRCRSARRGDWRLPFHGRGHYDGELGAWVGIREADGTDGGIKGKPYLCSCAVPDLADSGVEGPVPAPAWRMCDQELTFLKTPVNFGCRALVHVGHGRFCLVEVVPATVAEGAEARGGECLLHVTVFRAEHCKNGGLVVTPCRPGRSYLVPNCSLCLPGAFWI